MPDHSEIIEQAAVARNEGAFGEAADSYAAGGFVRVGSSFPFEPSRGPGMSAGLANLLCSAVCHRLADHSERARGRCEQGVSLAAEMADRSERDETADNEYDRARRGAWSEYVGDFRLVGGLSAHEAAYDEAVEIYHAAGDPLTGYAEWEHMRLMDLFNDVSVGSGHERTDWCTFDPERTLTEWVTYKTERFGSYLDELVTQDSWPIGDG